jgi:two-component system nitrate/nitrite sensor histidine kinase NarX
LIAGIEEAVERLRRDTGMRVFFQNEWHDPGLPPEAEIQALRIVQESLANIRKHSEAKVVRVILRSDVGRGQWALIEDDGVGFVEEEGTARPGEHIGLAIMSERAERIGAELQIESEPGEGTRVVLRFGASTPLAEAV